ncbi:MAG: hypothetical protein HZB13_04630 [Acidobacteria bacterium]|nr:hypothetical protein [Acidobacteriota bacterium]
MMPIRHRLRHALVAYAVIGIAAWLTLDGALRWMVLILLIALALKSWIAVRREELQ